MRIDACYDSHVHWPFTGEHAERLKLDHLTAAGQVKGLTTESYHFRNEWLRGFGWDAYSWPEPPHRKFLDEWLPSIPVALSRRDGHAVWVNTEALKRVGLWDSVGDTPGGRIERDSDGRPTGVLIDQAAELVHAKIGEPGHMELRRYLLKGMQIFNEAGITHIRDMTCNEAQWNEAVRLDESGILTLAVEEYFWAKSADDLPGVIDLVQRARAAQTANLRAMGVKLFFDGALGSEGAYLSRCYHGRSHRGLLLWEKAALLEAMVKTWEANLHVAIHVIGDEAADLLVTWTHELLAAGKSGSLHLEHCELLRPETIKKIKGLAVECHLQPSHWLSDQRWLTEKLGDLSQAAFPWRALQEAEIKFDFGSDAPIEPPDIQRTFAAIAQSAAAGVPRLLGDPATYMSHGDTAWAPNSFTIFENFKPTQIVFRGQHI